MAQWIVTDAETQYIYGKAKDTREVAEILSIIVVDE